MERTQLQAAIRPERGSKACERLRRAGRIPAVVYGKGTDPQSLSVAAKELREQMAHHHGGHAILDLVIDSNGQSRIETVLVQEIQRDPVTQKAQAVDFLKVNLTDKITTTVAIVLTGQSKGIKDGGILEHQIQEVEIACLPDDLPDELPADVTSVGLGGSVHVRDILCPPGVTILTPGDDVIAHINVPKLQVEVVEEPTEPTAAEPELVKQKGSKDEEE